MSKLIDLTGQKFGRLTVVRRNYPNGKRKQVMWLCKCECGNKKIIIGDSLRKKVTKSCGCFRKDKNKLNKGLASMRSLMRCYKNNAKKREYNFNLTEKQFFEITQLNCYYCGVKPNNIHKNSHSFGEYIYNGIDRIDNKKGYTIDNVVPSCSICNRAKKDLSLQEFKDWIERIHEKIFKGVKDKNGKVIKGDFTRA